jgi:hypothetical protein
VGAGCFTYNPPLGRGAFGITAVFGLLSSVVMIRLVLVKGVDVEKWNARAERIRGAVARPSGRAYW